MALIDKKNKYHVAIDGQGLFLQNVPNGSGYISRQAPLYNTRYAQGDRSYNDFAKFWFKQQTDWFQGLKNEKTWADDGKYYFAQNIDTHTQTGSFRLHRDISTWEDGYSDGIYNVVSGSVDGNVDDFFIGDDGVFEGTGTTAISGSPTNAENGVTHRDKLWIGTLNLTGSGSGRLEIYDGSSWTDVSSALSTAITGGSADIASVLGFESVGSDLYVGVELDDERVALVKTSSDNPTASGDWDLISLIDFDGRPMDIREADDGKILWYIAHRSSNLVKLRAYDPSSDVDREIKNFGNVNPPTTRSVGRMMPKAGTELLILLPGISGRNGSIWSYRSGVLSQIYKQDADKSDYDEDEFGTSDGDQVTTGWLEAGGATRGEDVYMSGLIYSNGVFHNSFLRPDDVDIDYKVIGVSADSGTVFLVDGNTDSTVWAHEPDGTTYRSGSDKNFLQFAEFADVAGVDKLAYSLIILFEKFDVGEEIRVEYSTDGVNGTYTELGIASYTNDGADVNQKRFLFPENTTYKTIWFRVYLNGDGSSTPVFNDFVLAFLPQPEIDKRWILTINAGNELKLRDGQKSVRDGEEIKALLEHAWQRNRVVDFQDLDYSESTLAVAINDTATELELASNERFPRSGRIRIGDEIIFYTDKSGHNKLTGLIRGVKGTKAVAHAQGVAVNNGYKILIEQVESRIPILNKEEEVEYTITLFLREVI